MPNKNFKIIKTERLPNAEALITGEINLSFLVELRPEALKHLGQHTKIPGFRPGKIPEDVLVKNLGEMRVLEEVAEIALAREFNNIVQEAKLSSIGRPEISITKMVPGTPLEFRLKIYLEPEFKLPDYKKIAQDIKEEKPDVTNLDKEVADVIKEITDKKIKVDLKEGDLSAGQGQAETLEAKVKENLLKEKEYKVLEKRRLKILEEIVKETKIEVPKILVDTELEKMLAQFQGDIERAGIKWDKYIKQIKKTEEEIKTEWLDKAEERVKAELIIFKIAEAEKIEPTKEEVEHGAKHLLEHHPDVDPIRVRLYIYNSLRNQKVIEFLGEQN